MLQQQSFKVPRHKKSSKLLMSKIGSTYGKVSYVFAYNTVDSLVKQGVSVDEEAFIAAVRDRFGR